MEFAVRQHRYYELFLIKVKRGKKINLKASTSIKEAITAQVVNGT